ncbi:MAG: DNA replication/repair protein RecF [Rhodospirillum sp.]|nr:DNA replication/repair protein RecF [Rhodospirillum sp.]MCF8487588.1 DNA replication/repair protein RecF [Rhodospirillum sp.]MCF8500243.1 DNA replication/repair protein RecF [Rhodospirillum sp.]
MPPSTKGRLGAAVTRLILTDFRCYASLRVIVEPRSVVLTGPNGAGKTNLLEALSFLAPGKGLRRAAIAEVARRGPGLTAAAGDGGWAVAARVSPVEGPPVDLGTGREPGPLDRPGSDRRVVRVDGEAASGQGVLGERLSVLWLTPDMDGLFRGGASDRRRFLDRLVTALDPDHASRANAYAHAQRERARLLREGRGTDAWLAGLEDAMARHGVALGAARRELVERLSASVSRAVGSFPRAGLALESEVDQWLAEGPALAAEDRLRDALASSRRRDAQVGGAAHGPHRDDLLVRHGPKDLPAGQASTGEQKAVLIALLLAQARVQAGTRTGAPLLLLDDVSAHLDEGRRSTLFEALDGLGVQAWVTGTDRQSFESWEKSAQFLRIEEASVVE